VLATEPEGRLAAIVDFTFNLGAGRLQTSTLRRRINQRDWQPG
jgi:lysozyme